MVEARTPLNGWKAWTLTWCTTSTLTRKHQISTLMLQTKQELICNTSSITIPAFLRCGLCVEQDRSCQGSWQLLSVRAVLQLFPSWYSATAFALTLLHERNP